MKTLFDKELLRPDEAAEYLSLSVKTIYGWIAEGKLDAVKIGDSQVLRIPRENILAILKPAIQ